MWMKMIPVALGMALFTCPEPEASARLEGTVRMEDGEPWRGGVFITCGESGLERRTDSRGRWGVDYELDLLPIDAEASPEGEVMVRCRVSAPADRPPFAIAYRSVPFHRERARRVTTRIDLVEGQVEPDPGPQP